MSYIEFEEEKWNLLGFILKSPRGRIIDGHFWRQIQLMNLDIFSD